MIEGESHSTRHISNQPHLMKDTQLDWTESDLQNSKSGGNQLTGGKKKNGDHKMSNCQEWDP